ncbi:MAG: hypothetical protein Ct9H300mP19_06290 [Dehalococcoidia bacterium]|nr:MAG: hypothetical protein Ct9H300mP19_06290 [Dehalococcoidia bacterium]
MTVKLVKEESYFAGKYPGVVLISTEAPVASAPALNARSIFLEVRKSLEH